MTKLYIQTLKVYAWPAAHEDGREGYAMTDESGQLDWMPKEEFEAVHRPIGNLSNLTLEQQKVEIERSLLSNRIEALAEMVNGPDFPGMPEIDQRQMVRQLNAMREYHAILTDRISAFC